MCFFGRRNPRLVRHLTAAAILTAGVALWLHFIYDIYQVQQHHVHKFHKFPAAHTSSLLTKDNLLMPITLGEGVFGTATSELLEMADWLQRAQSHQR